MVIYRVNDFAKEVGVSASTLRRWDNEGTLKAKRTKSNQRYYTYEDVLTLRGKKPINRVNVVYCRVSSSNQKADLDSQVSAMETFCLNSGIAVESWYKEIGGGMDFKRPIFLEIISRIEKGEIANLIIAHKDRLCRFGFEFFEDFALRHNCKILVVNQESLSPQEEAVEDMLSIVRVFSDRLYGLREYKKTLKEIICLSESENNE